MADLICKDRLPGLIQLGCDNEHEFSSWLGPKFEWSGARAKGEGSNIPWCRLHSSPWEMAKQPTTRGHYKCAPFLPPGVMMASILNDPVNILFQKLQWTLLKKKMVVSAGSKDPNFPGGAWWGNLFALIEFAAVFFQLAIQSFNKLYISCQLIAQFGLGRVWGRLLNDGTYGYKNFTDMNQSIGNWGNQFWLKLGLFIDSQLIWNGLPRLRTWPLYNAPKRTACKLQHATARECCRLVMHWDGILNECNQTDVECKNS